jgi:hypothetical protein
MSARIGIGLDIWANRGVAFSPEYQAVLTKATAQGFNLPTADQQIKQNTFLENMKNNGSFALNDLILVFANNGSKEFACINWKNPSGTQASLVSSPTFTVNQGFSGSTGGWINTNYAPNGSLNYKLNDASRYIYLRTFTNPPSSSMEGVAGSIANGTSTFISPNQRINQGGGINFSQTVNFQSVGMKSIHRLNSNDVVIFQNTTRIDGTAASTGLAGESQVILRAGNGFGGHQVSFYAMGANLVNENSTLVSAFSTYLTSL